MADKKAFARSVARGFVAGFLAPLTAINIGHSNFNVPKVPIIKLGEGSFTTDQKKIASDIKSAIHKYGIEKNVSQAAR